MAPMIDPTRAPPAKPRPKFENHAKRLRKS